MRKHRFTEEEVRALRRRYDAGGISTFQLAEEYGVAVMTIWRIVTRKTYRNVDDSS